MSEQLYILARHDPLDQQLSVCGVVDSAEVADAFLAGDTTNNARVYPCLKGVISPHAIEAASRVRLTLLAADEGK